MTRSVLALTLSTSQPTDTTTAAVAATIKPTTCSARDFFGGGGGFTGVAERGRKYTTVALDDGWGWD
jgi:hypothetical protein